MRQSSGHSNAQGGCVAGELPSLSDPGPLVHGDDPPEELYTLTGNTGSFMYMAPEVSAELMLYDTGTV